MGEEKEKEVGQAPLPPRPPGRCIWIWAAARPRRPGGRYASNGEPYPGVDVSRRRRDRDYIDCIAGEPCLAGPGVVVDTAG